MASSGLGWPLPVSLVGIVKGGVTPLWGRTAPRDRGDGEATLILPWCQWSSSAGAPGALLGHHFHLPACSCQEPAGMSRGCVPPCPQPWGVTASPEPGSWRKSQRRAGEGRAALPFPPRVSVLAEANHYLPHPSEAAARGCTRSACLYRCKHYTPEIPSLYITGQSLLWRLDLFLPLDGSWGACARADPSLGHPG